MYAMCVFYVCILYMYSVHVVHVWNPGMYVVYDWTDGTDMDGQDGRSHFRIAYLLEPFPTTFLGAISELCLGAVSELLLLVPF